MDWITLCVLYLTVSWYRQSNVNENDSSIDSRCVFTFNKVCYCFNNYVKEWTFFAHLKYNTIDFVTRFLLVVFPTVHDKGWRFFFSLNVLSRDAGTFEEEGKTLQDHDHAMWAESKCLDFGVGVFLESHQWCPQRDPKWTPTVSLTR